MNDVLLTVSGNIDPNIEAQIAQAKRPVADYIAMAQAFDADIIDYQKARQDAGLFGKLLERIGGANLLLAWRCFRMRRKYRVLFTDGEQVGIPLALLLKFLGFGHRARHLMIAHILSVPKKTIFFDWLGLAKYIDIFFVYATWQKKFIESRWKVPGERVVFTPFMVDAQFFSPDACVKGGTQTQLSTRKTAVICSAGLEFRDYPTLLAAVKGLDVHVVIAAASPWSKRADTTAQAEIPQNVTVRRFSQFELREQYAACQFVVMPLYDVNFQAGVTTILEAMAMGKAVICSRTQGQTDIIVDGESGIYVPPGDAAAMQAAIVRLLENPDEAERMGRNGRARVLSELSLDCYVKRLARYIV
jgi:glycosyltransferase involved in cell wall biosynthesis